MPAWQKFVDQVTALEEKTQQFKITLVHPYMYKSECTIYIALKYKSLSCSIGNV